MAKSDAVWGIDIGQCALKALRCRIDDDGQTTVADAFDFIEYPKILSQPEANPEELVREALQQFLSRNSVRGDKVAMSVSGQAGLARFFKPPPVDVKMIPNIVKYEARQQIPFALEDVIWDYQRMGGTVVDGFALDSEVGLFAMKREHVFRAIQPFLDADVEVDIVQLSPLCIFNFVVYDILGGGPAPEDIDPEKPPPSIVILAMGTETSDLVITNGTRLWQRNIPLGGNHFTKQLSKELKLTYAKAEHLKRNARQAEDPKTIFQAMRPVFNDLVTEVQRSIGYFRNIDRQAQIGRMVMLGNAVKLPGMQQYLEKNLGQEIMKFDSFSRLSGTGVVSAPSFKENILSFGVCYGLCLQGLETAKLRTNLLPREFVTQRMIRDKKPWAVASVGAFMLAFAFNFFFYYSSWHNVHEERAVDGVNWKTVSQQVDAEDAISRQYDTTYQDQLALTAHVEALGEELASNHDRKLLWLELIKAIDDSLPRNRRFPPGTIPDVKDYPFVQREELQIEHIESEYFPDLQLWFNGDVKIRYLQEESRYAASGATTGDPAVDAAADPAATQTQTPPETVADPSAVLTADGELAAEGEELIGPEGPGWVIEIQGHHYHNAAPPNQGGNYVRNTLLKNLREGKVRLSTEQGPMVFDMKELGIDYPILAVEGTINRLNVIPNPYYTPLDLEGSGESGGYRTGVTPRGASSGRLGTSSMTRPGTATVPRSGAARPGVGTKAGVATRAGTATRSATGAVVPRRGEAATTPEDLENLPEYPAPKSTFVVQFCWQPKPLAKRLQEREEQQMRAAAEAALAADAEQTPGTVPPEGTEPGTAAPAPTAPRGGPAPGGAVMPPDNNALPAPQPDNVPPAGTMPPTGTVPPTAPAGTVPPDAAIPPAGAVRPPEAPPPAGGPAPRAAG